MPTDDNTLDTATPDDFGALVVAQLLEARCDGVFTISFGSKRAGKAGA